MRMQKDNHFVEIRPPLPALLPRALPSAPPSCCNWNSWPQSCSSAARRCRRSCCAPPASWARAVCCVLTRSSGTAASCAVCPHCGRCCAAPNRKTRTTTRIPNDPECRTGSAVCGIFVALRSNNVVKKCEKTISKRLKPCYTDYKVYKPTAIGLSVLKLSKL